MAVTARLARRLHENLGPEPAEDLVTWLEEMRAENRAFKEEMRLGFGRVETLIERRSADLIKWSFVFWVGAVAAIAMLAGVIGR
jgi:hypothetical protein